MPDREFADQLSLVEAVALSVGREVGQSVKRQPGFRPLACLPFDRIDSAPGCGLGRGHAGGGERPNGDLQTVWQLQLVGLGALRKVDHASSLVNEVHRQGRRGFHREPGDRKSVV